MGFNSGFKGLTRQIQNWLCFSYPVVVTALHSGHLCRKIIGDPLTASASNKKARLNESLAEKYYIRM